MPDNKKRKNKSRNTKDMAQLRQSTLLGSVAGSSSARTSPGKLVISMAAKRKYESESSESSDIGAIKLGPATPVKSDDPGICAESPVHSRAKKKRYFVVESGSDGEEPQSSGSEVVVPRRRRLRRLASIASNSSSNSRQRRSTSKGKGKQLDTDEDLGEVDQHRIVGSRLRPRGKKTGFQKNLEKLRRRKMGETMSSSESNEESTGQMMSGEEHLKPFKKAKSTDGDVDSLFSGSEDNSDSSSNFIVEDDGQSVAAQLPSEFSMRSHDDLSHQFKIIFQFFVHIAVRPAADRRAFMQDQMKAQDYFAFPLRITRRKLSGLRDSLIASSVWRPKFKKALESYPTFECIPLDFAVPSCDACHLGGRLSTLLGRLGGISYDKLGFVDHITSDPKEDSGDDSESSVTRFKKSKFGFREFHLGRFCARRVQAYHEFSHWEHCLFNIICSELDDLHAARGKRGFVRIAFAGGRKPPNDLTDADGICEWLDERGIIDQEWRKMKTMIESAHKLEVSAKRGEVD